MRRLLSALLLLSATMCDALLTGAAAAPRLLVSRTPQSPRMLFDRNGVAKKSKKVASDRKKIRKSSLPVKLQDRISFATIPSHPDGPLGAFS